MLERAISTVTWPQQCLLGKNTTGNQEAQISVQALPGSKKKDNQMISKNKKTRSKLQTPQTLYVRDPRIRNQKLKTSQSLQAIQVNWGPRLWGQQHREQKPQSQAGTFLYSQLCYHHQTLSHSAFHYLGERGRLKGGQFYDTSPVTSSSFLENPVLWFQERDVSKNTPD